jgi:hypothetical protein
MEYFGIFSVNSRGLTLEFFLALFFLMGLIRFSLDKK